MAVNKRKILASAQRHIQKGSLDKALKDYVRLLETDPRDANVRLKVGDLQLRRNQPKEAIDAYLKVADQFMRDGFDAKAVAIYKQVTKIDGKRYEVYLPLAELYQRLGLVSEAMAALQSAADGYQQEGKRRDALDLLRKMSGLDPSNVPSRLKVADLLAKEELLSDAVNEYDAIVTEAERQGDWETQIAVFERIVEVDPSRIASAQAFTRLLLERNQTEQAEHVARKCVEADPDRAESNEMMADVLGSLGKHDEAVPFFKKAAAAWRELGDEAKARDLVQRHVSDDGIDFGAGDLRNDVPSSDSPAASTFGEASLETDIGFDDPPTHGVGIGDLADPDAEMDLGFDADSSSESASGEDLPELVPEPVDADGGTVDSEQLLAEASVYVRYGKHEKAIEAIQHVLDHEPANAVALEQMGDTLAAAGNEAPAVKAWVKASQLLSPDTDAEKIESLRSRVGALDEQAAAAEPPPADAGEPAAVAEAPAAPPAASAAEPDPVEEIELVAPLEEALEEEPPPTPIAEPEPAPAVAEAPTAPSDDLDIDIDIDFDGLEDEAAAVAATSEASASGAGASTSTSAQIAEEIEEADSLFDRGLLDQAEAIYLRVLELAPNHPAAQLRTGEIQDARAQAEVEAAEAAAEAQAAAVAKIEDTTEPETEPDTHAPVASPDDASLEFERDIDLEAALADAADAVDQVEAGVAEPPAGDASEEASLANAPEQDDDSIEIEFDVGEDPDVSFAGLNPSEGEPEALEIQEEEAPLDFADEVDFGDEAAPAGGPDPVAPPPEPVAVVEEPPVPEPVAVVEEPPVPEPVAVVEEPPVPLEPVAVVEEPPAPEPVAVVEEPPAPEPVAVVEEPPVHGSLAVIEPAPTPRVASNDDSVVESPGPISFDVGQFDPDESFDLAAELSDALSEDPGSTASAIAKEERTGSLETLFSEFKRGVEQTLGEGDVETHFDLGIAYREMGLFEDAIGEFQHALGGETRRLDALHLMALCALELDRPSDATAHLEQALSSAEWPEDREAPLRFDLGRAYVAVGDTARALDTFRRVAEIDPTFCNVEARIAALAGGGADTDGRDDDQETYESFDDLIDAAEEPDSDMESFEEFQDFNADDDDAAEADGADDASGDDGETGSSSSNGSSRRRRKVSFI